MSTNSEINLKILLGNIALSLLIFFLIFYMLAALLYGAFGVSKSRNVKVYYTVVSILLLEKFDGKTPFDFKRCCVGSDINTVNFLSLAITYILSTGFYLIFIRHKMWDYALTTAVVHLASVCAVMREFPTNWEWLVTFGISVLFMAGIGELCCRFCFRSKVDTDNC